MRRKTHWNVAWSKGKENTTDAFYVRGMVFVVEQGFQNEFDDLDAKSWHVIIYDDKEPVGTGRTFQNKEGEWQLGRICVLEAYRSKGVGRVILENLEEKIKSLGGKTASLSAQTRVKGFYIKNGYQPQGEEYMDEHCPHIKMVKNLD